MTYSAVILADTPTAYWRLGEPSGTTAFDASGNNLNGTYVGGSTLGTPGLIQRDGDTAATFNGTTGFVNAGNPAALQLSTGSVECWIVPTGNHAANFTGFVGKNGAYFVGFNSNSLAVSSFDFGGGAARPSTKTLALGTTHYVALTFQLGISNGTQIWVDGTLVLTTTTSLSSQANVLGLATSTANGQDFPGTLDEVAVYSYVLSSAQIQAHYQAGQGYGLTQPIVVGVKFGPYDRS